MVRLFCESKEDGGSNDDGGEGKELLSFAFICPFFWNTTGPKYLFLVSI